MALKAKQVYGALTSEVKSIVSGIASWSVDDVNKTITAVTTGGQTLTIHFMQPSDGVGVDSVDLVDGHIIVTYTDTTTHDAGEFPIPTIEVGTTETVEPTEPAEVTAEDTATGIKLNFKIPRGESGGGGGGGEVTGVKGSAESTFRKGNVSISAANIGLDKVDNTSDLNKPVSTPQQAALDLKVDKVAGKGLSTNDYTDTDKAEVAKVAGKADADDVIDSASYDSTNHLILFKNGTTTLFSLDAAAFVKDGMVDTVEITGGNLVITFNTDAGKQAISIPLTDIFDPSNYYNKTATDNLLADKADKVSEATNGNFAGLDSNGNLTDSGKKAADFQSKAYVYEGSKDTEQDIKDMLDAHLDAMENLTQDVFSFNDAARVIGGGTWVCVLYRVSASYASANFYGYYPYTKETICTCAKFDGRWQPIKKLLRTADLTSSVISESEKPITSGGVYTALQGKADKTDVASDIQDSIKETVGWTGKNLIVNGGVGTRTVNGVTFVVNQDGSVTCNGTATGSYANFVMLSRIDNVVILKSGTYILSGCPSGGGQGKYQLVAQATRNGELYSYGEDWGDGKTITAEDGDSLQIVVNITGGQTVDNITFYPMLRRADIADDTYEPYHESVEAMYEEKAEQEEVNGIVNALGAKNILNPSWLYNNSALTITPAYDIYGNLKKYTLDGTVTGNQVSILFARRAAKTLTLEAGTSWIFSIGNTLPSGGSMQVGYTHPTTGEWTLLKSQRADNLAFTVPDEAEGMYWTIQIVINDLTFDGYDIFPMLRPSFIEDDTYAPFAKANKDLTREIEAMPQKVFTTPKTLLSTTNDADDFQCGFTRCSDANANLPTTGSGSSVLWYDILTIRQSNDPSSELWGYGFQLAIQTTTTATQSDTYVRAVNGGATPVWGAWKKLTT